jgi:hypothetical protein
MSEEAKVIAEELQLPLKLESLEIKDDSYDFKIEALNVFATVSIKDYLDIGNVIKSNNELQRKRVANNSTVYALLKDDMLNGCLIPAIVLALDETLPYSIDEKKVVYSEIVEHIRKQAPHLKLLDGLQRTNILLDLQQDLSATDGKPAEQIEADLKSLNELYDRKIRLEVYININRFGILYRMLTLNTGQTPMSLRHQIEILYSDYYNKQKDGIILIREAFESGKTVKIGQYKFSDIVEGVTSFIDGSEFPLDRFDLLTYIKSLKKLSIDENKEDLFEEFLTTYHLLIQAIVNKSSNWALDYNSLSTENLSFFPLLKTDDDGNKVYTSAFGNNTEQIFLKSQVITGLGAALSSLKTKGSIKKIEDIKTIIPNIKFSSTPKEAFDIMIVRLEQIRKESRKIGESQRTFFKFFFTTLFNKYDEDAFLLIENAIETAFLKTT